LEFHPEDIPISIQRTEHQIQRCVGRITDQFKLSKYASQVASVTNLGYVLIDQFILSIPEDILTGWRCIEKRTFERDGKGQITTLLFKKRKRNYPSN
jgi:hypothetical protein